MTNSVFVSHSPEETEDFAKKFAASLKAGDAVAFYGGMGAGKTRFAAGICEGLGCRGPVSSPTYAVMNVYAGGRLAVYHFDMYRVTGYDDLETAGFFDCLEAGGVTLVEWAENIADFLPENAVKITLSPAGETSREIRVER